MFDPTMLSVYPTESALPATKAENAPRRRYELNENSGRLSYSVRKCVKFGINSGPVWRWVGGCRTSRIASGEVGWSRVVDGFGGSNDMTRIVQYPARPMTRGLCGGCLLGRFGSRNMACGLQPRRHANGLSAPASWTG